MDDLISRQAAIDAVHKNYDVILDFTSNGQTISSSIEDILSELPSAQPEPHDLVSRRAALEAMDTWDKFGCDPDGKLVRYDDDKHYTPYVHYEDMVHTIKNLPPAQPEPHEGHWINGKCNLCGEHAPFWAMASTYHESKYYPNCGAKMDEEKESNHD